MLAACIVMPNIMPNDMRVKQKVTLTRDLEPCDDPWRHILAICRTFDSRLEIAGESDLNQCTGIIDNDARSAISAQMV